MTGQGLAAHLAIGVTTVCRAWVVRRKDGVAFGFTDHDRDLMIDGVTCAASTGLSARALQQATGLSVDNSEAMGALSDAAVREEDIAAGRFDAAEVTAWLVNWQAPEERMVLFRGSFGEIVREKGAFRVELRGLTERLNLPMGRVYQAACSARLGDARCSVDLAAPGMRAQGTVRERLGPERLMISLDVEPGEARPEGWFAFGQLAVLSGAATGLAFEVRADRGTIVARDIRLWQAAAVDLHSGDRVELVAGCDRRKETCAGKFGNILNFRGFPYIPGEDWLRRPPSDGAAAGRVSRPRSIFGSPT